MQARSKAALMVVSVTSVISFAHIPAFSQFARIPIVRVEKRTRPSVPSTRVRRNAGVRKVESKVVVRTERVVSSNLVVTTEPGAKVLLEMRGPRPTKIEKVADAGGTAVFQDVKPGVYKAQSSKDDFETAEDDSVTITAKTSHGVDLDLKPLTYDLKIKTNVANGDVLFAQAQVTGQDASGGITSKRLGNYCVVEIAPNGEAVISDLKKGYYEIDIRPPLEFEQKLTGIRIPDDLDDETAELRAFEIELEKQLSTETFSPTAWASTDWTMPSSWKLDKGIKVKNAAGMALPRDERYRHYRNFELIADVKVPDDGALGFVLRAMDEKNFYLLQISGRRAPQPNSATLFSVKDGVRTAVMTLTTEAFEKTISSDSGFRIYILNEKDEDFQVRIKDSETGKIFPVGQFSDPRPTHPKGSPGLGAPLPSSFEVSYFIVCTPRCR